MGPATPPPPVWRFAAFATPAGATVALSPRAGGTAMIQFRHQADAPLRLLWCVPAIDPFYAVDRLLLHRSLRIADLDTLPEVLSEKQCKTS